MGDRMCTTSRKPKNWVVLCLGVAGFLFAHTIAAIAGDPVLHPADRIGLEPTNPNQVIVWPAPIKLQLLGELSPETAFMTAARVAESSRFAGVEFGLAGRQRDWFDGRSTVLPDANFVMLFPQLSDDGVRSTGGSLAWPTTQWGGGNVFVDAVAGSGLIQAFPGCYGRMLLSPEGALLGYVSAYVQELSNSNMDKCMDTVVPSAFGLNPNVTRYSLDLPSPLPNSFYDASEVYFELAAIAACKDQDGEVALACVKGLTTVVWSTHGQR